MGHKAPADRNAAPEPTRCNAHSPLDGIEMADKQSGEETGPLALDVRRVYREQIEGKEPAGGPDHADFDKQVASLKALLDIRSRELAKRTAFPRMETQRKVEA